ncbi:hypothetical protein [Haloquadratum walsbyi]|uniref:hypothetical protein n=1 Tax=Haloquadratum walsbyi TaxID=293091 RepID=UPI0023F11780|nr:hypothetical protein [Haloquadratum walsbyi]
MSTTNCRTWDASQCVVKRRWYQAATVGSLIWMLDNVWHPGVLSAVGMPTSDGGIN